MSGRHHPQPSFRRTLFELAHRLMQPLKHRASSPQLHLEGRILLHQGLMQPGLIQLGLLMPSAVLELALPLPAAVIQLLLMRPCLMQPELMHLGENETAVASWLRSRPWSFEMWQTARLASGLMQPLQPVP